MTPREPQREPSKGPVGRLVGALGNVGPSAQAAIPGAYAWAMTVAPAAFSKGSPSLAKVVAMVGLVAVLSAPWIEGLRAPPRDRTAKEPGAPRTFADLVEGARTAPASAWARVWSVWGLVLSSALVWALVPAALSPARLDNARGILGMAGWALFAFTSAAPALPRERSPSSRVVDGSPLKPRSSVARGDGLYIALVLVAVLALQTIGWGVASPERAVLVRVGTLAIGVALLTTGTTIALARHGKRLPASRGARMRRATPWLALLSILAGTGIALSLMR